VDLPGFVQIKKKGEVSRRHTYREDGVPTYVCRQTRPGTEVSWETAPLPENWPGEVVTFVFAGGLGWVSEAKTEGFEFLLNGREALRFDISTKPKTWTIASGKVSVSFLPKRLLPLDAVGFFYVTIARDLLTSGRPCTLSVRSLGSGSKRWFAVHPYSDILSN
jgi:hypothetical protein